MSNDTVPGAEKPEYREIEVLNLADAGEVMTLQRAAYVTEARAHQDLDLPALTQSLPELRAELDDPAVIALGIREHGRLLGAVRLRQVGSIVELGRLTVVPDRQGEGIGGHLLREAETTCPGTREIRLFTGERSHANLRLYRRRGYVECERTDAGEYNLVHLVKHLG